MMESNSYYVHPTAIVESLAIGEGTKIWHFAHVRKGSKIGKNCNIGKAISTLTPRSAAMVKIQNFVSVYKGVTIEDDVFVVASATFTNDLYPRAFIWNEEHISATRICRGASIGANATLVCGITVGEYAMIGAGSVVATDVPPLLRSCWGNPPDGKGVMSAIAAIGVTGDAMQSVYKCSACGMSVGITK